MMDPRMTEALNRQINEELASWYIYLSMATWLEDENWSGMAHWVKKQAQEEMNHAMKIYGFVNERRAKVDLSAIPAPKTSWDSVTQLFDEVLAHEEHITACIHKLYKLAREIDDLPAQEFLNWFVKEQVEEEANADQIVQKIRRIGDGKHGLFMLDHELGKR